MKATPPARCIRRASAWYGVKIPVTFEQAVKMLTDEVHLERQLALSEVKRYTEEPTQPSAYMVGRQMIFKLRERAKKRIRGR